MKGEATVSQQDRPMATNKWPRDAVSGIALLALSLWLWYFTASFPQLDDGYPGPSLFPRLVALGLGFAGVILLIQSLRSKQRSKKKRTIHWSGLVRFGAGMGLLMAYPFLIEQLHFIPVMALLIFVFGLLLRSPRWHALMMATLSAALIYALFTQLMGVPL